MGLASDVGLLDKLEENAALMRRCAAGRGAFETTSVDVASLMIWALDTEAAIKEMKKNRGGAQWPTK